MPAKAGIQEIISNVCGPVPGSRPTPGRAAERCVIPISSAHTGEGRYPGDHPQTSAGHHLDPGLRWDERRKGSDFQLYPLIPAKAGIQEIIPKPQQGQPLGPGLRRGERRKSAEFQIHPLIPAKAGIQPMLPKPRRARPWFPAYAGMSGGKVRIFNYIRSYRRRPVSRRSSPNLGGPSSGSRPTPG